MSTFLSLSDDDIELLNRQFGLKLTREEWNRRLTTTPTFASLVRSYFDWHISELAALAAGDDRLPAGINAIDAPFPPTARGASEPDARLRAARFMLCLLYTSVLFSVPAVPTFFHCQRQSGTSILMQNAIRIST